MGDFAVGVGAVDALVDPEQAASANVIVTTSSVTPQRITASCVNQEGVKLAAHILSPSLPIHCLRIHQPQSTLGCCESENATPHPRPGS
jgi:hypothetical protein